MNNDIAVRVGPRLTADPRRVIAKLFVPGEETAEGQSRARAVVDRLLAVDESDVEISAEAVVSAFGGRHRDLAVTLATHYDFAEPHVARPAELTDSRRTMLGAIFTHEYSTEAAALCNPSIVAHPDQSNLDSGELRFVMTVRCIGEGHISSIGFRTGVIGGGAGVQVDEPTPFLVTGRISRGSNQKRVFLSKLDDLGDGRDEGRLLLGGLPEVFTDAELDEAIGLVHTHSRDRDRMRRAIAHVQQIASCGYDLEFDAESTLSERLLWPTAATEQNGMEDARLVRFEDEGEVTYQATYTAYDGASIDTRLLTTKDFRRFQVSAVAGRPTRNKGLALFPRRIRGRYYAISRWDRESLSLAGSTDGGTWEQLENIYLPSQAWDLIQVGNGGSPIETPHGWLLITHGVGPMRSYGLGAILLDLDDPSVVLGCLRRPLLTPIADERDGYAPNVVYTCGALLHDGILTIPYGISDGAIGFAQAPLAELLTHIAPSPQ